MTVKAAAQLTICISVQNVLNLNTQMWKLSSHSFNFTLIITEAIRPSTEKLTGVCVLHKTTETDRYTERERERERERLNKKNYSTGKYVWGYTFDTMLTGM